MDVPLVKIIFHKMINLHFQMINTKSCNIKLTQETTKSQCHVQQIRTTT